MKLQGLFLLGSLTALLVGPMSTTAGARIEQHEISSAILAAAEEAADNGVAIYLPEGYDTSGLNYPVVYLLHGTGGWPGQFLSSPGQARSAADKLILCLRRQPKRHLLPG